MSETDKEIQSIEELVKTVAIARLDVSSLLIDYDILCNKNERIFLVEGVAAFNKNSAHDRFYTDSTQYIETKFVENEPLDIVAAREALGCFYSVMDFLAEKTLAWLCEMVEVAGAESVAVVYFFKDGDEELKRCFKSTLDSEDTKKHGRKKLIYSGDNANDVKLLWNQNHQCLQAPSGLML